MTSSHISFTNSHYYKASRCFTVCKSRYSKLRFSLHYTESSSPDKMICIIKNFVIATDMFLAGFMRFNFQNDKSSNFQQTQEVIPQRPSNISLDTTEKQTGKVIFKSHVDHFIIYIYNIYREGKTRSNPAMKPLRGEQAKRDRKKERV